MISGGGGGGGGAAVEAIGVGTEPLAAAAEVYCWKLQTVMRCVSAVSNDW